MALDAHTSQQPLSQQQSNHYDISLIRDVNNLTIHGGTFTLNAPIETVSPRSSSQQHIHARKLCPLPVASFTGRKKILERMHKYFNSDAEYQRIFVLYGLGGSGKSQLAFKFLQECQTNKRFSDIFYIDATNEQTLGMDLKAIRPENAQSVDGILRWLADQDREWLLFFDNADDVQLNLQKFFPPCASGNILVTSRNRALRRYTAKGSEQNVTGMEDEDATNLLFRLSQAEETDENKLLAAQIVQDLGNFALAVSQAGTFIHTDSSLSDYRKLYQRERDNLLQNEEVQGSDPAVYATWRLSYDKLDASARCFLQICSMLHREGILEEIFERAALSRFQLQDRGLQSEVTRLLILLGKEDSGWSAWKFRKVIKRLGSYSLIEYDERNCIYSLHPLVHQWSGTTISENGHLMRKCVVSIIGLSIPSTFGEEDNRYRRTVLKHIVNATTSLDPTEIDRSIAAGIAWAYFEQAYWTRAEELIVGMIEKSKRLLGEDHSETLLNMAWLASTYRNQSRFSDAEELEKLIMVRKKRLLGEDNPGTLSSMNNLATTYIDQGRWNEAEELQVTVMEKMKRVFGEDDLETLMSMGNLATIYHKQGRLNEAEELNVIVMEKMKRLLGEDNPDTLMIMGNLANTYFFQYRLNEAQDLQEVVLEKRKQLLGEDHPHTLLTMESLVGTYFQQGRWNDAEELAMVVMEKTKRLLGEDDPRTLSSMDTLANTYNLQGRWNEAEELQLVVTEKTKRIFGEDHPKTLASLANLAATYAGQGRWNEAEELNVMVMEKQKRVLGEDHPVRLLTMRNLVDIYNHQGRWKPGSDDGKAGEGKLEEITVTSGP